jgi:hypothetical protein
MATFLKNDGSILLDAVLTDYGRQLLAKGDGSFNITKFSFGDDEIDYGLYNPTDKDSNILKTPILEALTNNLASMNSQLLTLASQKYLFLPILDLVTTVPGTQKAFFVSGSTASSIDKNKGILFGDPIVIDQGINSAKSDKSQKLQADLKETEYMISIDYRFGMITDPISQSEIGTPTIDDDYMATYTLNMTTSGPVTDLPAYTDNESSTLTPTVALPGQRGTRLKFKFDANDNLVTSTFAKYGKIENISGSKKVIRSTITVTGVKTGYSLQIPIAYIINN